VYLRDAHVYLLGVCCSLGGADLLLLDMQRTKEETPAIKMESILLFLDQIYSVEEVIEELNKAQLIIAEMLMHTEDVSVYKELARQSFVFLDQFKDTFRKSV
jgi:hypothetical protein